MAADLKNSCLHFHVFEFPVKCRNSMDFLSCFRSSIGSPESSVFINSLQTSRIDMEKKLISKDTLLEKIQAIEAYISNLFKLMDSLNNQPPVYIDRPMVFDAYPMLATERMAYCEYNETIYGIICALADSAVLHYNYGIQLSKGGDVISAAKEFTKSAELMQYLELNLIPKWTSGNVYVGGKNMRKPPQANTDFCKAMKLMFQAAAQTCSIWTAMHKEGGTPPAVMTKLCVAVVTTTAQSMDLFKILSNNKTCDSNQVTDLIVNLGFNREFYTALSCFYHAEGSIKSDQYGVALGYYNKARQLLTSQVGFYYTSDAPCIPKINTKDLEPVRAGVDNLFARINTSYNKVDRDNNIIHFQMQPKGDLIAELPSGIFVIPLKAYIQPNTNPTITFVKIEVKSIFSRVKDSLTFSSSPDPTNIAPSFKSTEEIKKTDVNTVTATAPIAPSALNPSYITNSCNTLPIPNGNVPYIYNPNPSTNTSNPSGYTYEPNHIVPNQQFKNLNLNTNNGIKPQENFGNKSDYEIAKEMQRRFDAEDLRK